MRHEQKPMFSMFLILSGALLAIIICYYCYPLWGRLGYTNALTDDLALQLYRSSLMKYECPVRLICLFFCAYAVIVRSGTSKRYPWSKILSFILSGLGLFLGSILLPTGMLYILATIVGYVLFLAGAIMLGRMYRSFDSKLPGYLDTFPQCEDLIENRYSVNIPISYQYGGKTRDGMINVVNPFRGTMILGTPGSGKSYSIYGHFIRQMIRKGYSMFVYDFKFPDLTRQVMAELLDGIDSYQVRPKFYYVNFDDPLHSHRFNPLDPKYLTDPIDSTEIAEIILKNAHRGGEKKDDFFSLSARCYIDLLIWFLKIYADGKFCTFPHLIQLMGQDYKEVFDVLKDYAELEVKRNTFSDAIKDQALEQLQGQIATARVHLNAFASKTLYWTLSGDDFSLDINNPDEPKIICVGNNPKRQSVYGTTLAMLMSQLFKIINVPGRMHSAILIDELPTVYLKGLDNLINTARSNKVAVVIGAQDKSQLVRDYDKKESDVIFNTVGNVFAGSVKGTTAEGLSKSIGKEERQMFSHSEGESSESNSISYQLRELLPASKIEALSQGCFCGYVADSNSQKIHPKIFCGEVKVGERAVCTQELPCTVNLTPEKMEDYINLNYASICNDVKAMIKNKSEKKKEDPASDE